MYAVLKWISLNYFFLIEVILVFGLMIFVHELGHFIVAKLVKTNVREFYLGMGPRLFKIRYGETDYGLRLFPIGGYVSIEGEDEKPKDTSDSGNFQNKSVPERMAIIVAGCAMNYITALVIFLLVGIIFGILVFPPKIDKVVKDTPAYKVGLKSGDVILAINGEKIRDGGQLVTFINTHPQKKLNLLVQRNNKTFNVEVTPFSTPDFPFGRIGFVPTPATFQKSSFLESVKFSFVSVWGYTVMPLMIIKRMITKEIPFNVIKKSSAGPIGIGSFIFLVARQEGLAKLLYLAAILNVAIGLFNLFPIPALDGSRLVFLGVEAIRRKPINQELEGKIHWIGLMLLLLLVVLISYQDILRIIKW